MLGLYEGSASDKESWRQSGIIPLLSPALAVMVDKGVGKVQQPDFLFKGNQMSAHDVLEIQSIACLGDHAERLIRTAKENKLFDTEIPLYISGSINQLFTVTRLLSN